MTTKQRGTGIHAARAGDFAVQVAELALRLLNEHGLWADLIVLNPHDARGVTAPTGYTLRRDARQPRGTVWVGTAERETPRPVTDLPAGASWRAQSIRK
jgi:hypothetical protein